MKIKAITIINLEGTKGYRVGETVWNSTGNVCGKVERIENESQEYPDHIHVQYSVYSSTGSTVSRIINCPIEVEYF